jgi:hypothetical protein
MLPLGAHPYAMEFRNADTKKGHLPSSNKFSASASSSDPEENIKTSGRTVGEVTAVHGDSKNGAEYWNANLG